MLARTPGARVLLVHGDCDEFTGARAYEAWAGRLVEISSPESESSRDGGEDGARVRAVCVPGASHFWRSRAAMRALLRAVDGFLIGPASS